MTLKPFSFFSLFALLCTLIILSGCSTTPCTHLTYIPKTFDDLPGWQEDHHQQAIPALERTCRTILKKSDSTAMITRKDGQGQAQDWKPFCQRLMTERENGSLTTDQEARHFLEANLQPYQMGCDSDTQGTFTGYYVPILRGSHHRHGRYQTPLYKLPKKGRKIPRSQIVKGALKNKGLELVWVDDPIEAFFIQIQGSGQVQLENGQMMNLGYAGQNGYPYFPIGKALMDRGELTSDTVNMHSIKKWLREHPREAEKIMSLNKSYVFFKERSGSLVIGAHGVPLTPRRSMAVDRSYVSLGTPLWLDAESPDAGAPRLRHLLVAQDVGGAIKGAIRGDYYWGIGDAAGQIAGRMNSQGQLYVLFPLR